MHIVHLNFQSKPLRKVLLTGVLVVLKIIAILLFLGLLAAEFQNGLAAAGSSAYEMGQVTTQPVPKKPIRLRVPSAVRKRGGEVTLRFLVTKEGNVESITVVKFSDSDLVDPVYSAYENARYSPGVKNGVPVDTWITVTEKAEK